MFISICSQILLIDKKTRIEAQHTWNKNINPHQYHHVIN